MASSDLNGQQNGEEGVREVEDGATMTVTIVLDNNNQNHHKNIPPNDGQQDAFTEFLSIPSPPSPSQLLENWPNSSKEICIRDLPLNISNLLEIRLNSPIFGSMRNWEFLAAHFGLSLDEIVGMRRSENPMGTLLVKFGQEPFAKLLDLIGQSGRIDVLLSLLPFSHKIFSTLNRHSPQMLLPAESTAFSATSTFSLPQPRSPPQQPFIFILHHEKGQNKVLRRFNRMLIKNLEIYAERNGIKIVDIDKCIAENDLLGSMQKYFESAWQILMALSPDYAEQIVIDSGVDLIDQMVELKRNLHRMTFQEVLYNRGENRRFRVILMQGTKPECIPRGWPSNTLHYRFPEDFGDLCERVFERTEK